MSCHKCAADGCETLIETEKLMCFEHWRLVPAKMQKTINTEWRQMRSAKTSKSRLQAISSLKMARDSAITAVRARGVLA